MLAFADDLLQIELGGNSFQGSFVRQQTPPRLRAYGVGATVGYLIERGLANDAGARAQAVYLPEQSADFYASVLVPTIDYVSINENDAYIELVGQLGRAQGLVKPSEVRVGGGPQTAGPGLLERFDGLMQGGEATGAPSWTGDLLQAPLRPRQLDRGGYVQVVNGDRWSNPVQITFWEIPITIISVITGGLMLQMTMMLALRADVRGYRLQPKATAGPTPPRASWAAAPAAAPALRPAARSRRPWAVKPPQSAGRAAAASAAARAICWWWAAACSTGQRGVGRRASR